MVYSVPFDHILTVAEENGIPLLRVAAEIRRMGYNAVDMEFETLAGEKQDTYTALLDANGLRIRAVNLIADFAHCDATHYRPVVFAAAKIKARYLVVTPGMLFPNIPAADAISRMITELQALAVLAEGYGVHVLFRNLNHIGTPYSSPAELQSFLDGAPGAGLQFDAGNMYMRGENTVVVFRDLLSHVRRVTLDDVLTDDVTYGDIPLGHIGEKFYYPAPVGFGDIPMKTMVRSFKDFAYAGDVLVTAYHAKDILDVLETSIAFIKENEQ